MIIDSDHGRVLADLVVAEVVKRFPSVAVEQPMSSFCSIVYFTPPNAEGAPILLYANFDWSFQLEVDGWILFEDFPMEESESERVTRIVEEISKIAINGLAPPDGWLHRLLSPRRRSEPWV